MPLDLLAVGADPRLQRSAALYEAVMRGKHDCAAALLAAGADPAAKARAEARFAAQKGDAEVLRAYLATGADPNGPGIDGCFLADAARDESIDCFRLLLDHGANPHFESELPLRTAAGNGALGCLKILLAAGAGPNVTARGVNAQGHAWSAKTALTEAAYHGHLGCLDALIDAGADLDADRSAALYMATASGRLDCVQRLLAAGADPREDERGHPLFAASKFNHPHIAAVLREAIARKAKSSR